MPYHFGHRHEFYLDATASWLAQRRARAPRPRRVRAAGTPGNSGFFFSPASTLVSSSCSAPKPLRACQAGVRGRAPPHLSWNPAATGPVLEQLGAAAGARAPAGADASAGAAADAGASMGAGASAGAGARAPRRDVSKTKSETCCFGATLFGVRMRSSATANAISFWRPWFLPPPPFGFFAAGSGSSAFSLRFGHHVWTVSLSRGVHEPKAKRLF